MSNAGYLGNLNPTAPEFVPANLRPISFFDPTRIYLPPPHYPRVFRDLFGPLPPQTSFTPTRAVMLLPISADVSESSIRRGLEVFGEVRGVQMERADEGIVTVHFYNLRHSQRALRGIRERHMQHQEQVLFGCGYTTARGFVSGRTVWAHFVFPQLAAVPEGNNQGSLVIMNLEPTVSSTTLRHIFQVYGDVKEIRETPFKREQRFVEFYDVRDAARALSEMNGKNINGKQIVIQFSRPGGFSRKLFLFFNQPKPSNACFSLGQHKNNNNRKQRIKNNLNNSCFTINEDAIAAEPGGWRGGRTTVMIRNIPNKYTQKLFLKMLDTHCSDSNKKIISEGNNAPISSYDFVYLPIDFSNKCNIGYGFVNMTTPEAVWKLYKAFHNQQWRVFNSSKICEVTYARVQGVESLKQHFKNSKHPRVEMEQYMPVFFSPPRDGLLLTEPISVVVDLGAKLVADSCHSRGETGMSHSSSHNTMDGSDGCCLGARIETAASQMTKA